jgi:hypothetical protein
MEIINIILNIALFFVVGLVECVVCSLNSKFRQRNRYILIGISARIYLIIWFFVLTKFVKGEMSLLLFLFYMEGYSWGDVYGVKIANYIEKMAEKRGFKRKYKTIYKLIKK